MGKRIAPISKRQKDCMGVGVYGYTRGSLIFSHHPLLYSRSGVCLYTYTPVQYNVVIPHHVGEHGDVSCPMQYPLALTKSPTRVVAPCNTP